MGKRLGLVTEGGVDLEGRCLGDNVWRRVQLGERDDCVAYVITLNIIKDRR